MNSSERKEEYPYIESKSAFERRSGEKLHENEQKMDANEISRHLTKIPCHLNSLEFKGIGNEGVFPFKYIYKAVAYHYP